MNLKNHREYAMCDYNQNISKDDKYKLGDVVINIDNEIGIIIQVHGEGEYRTDMFGNCCSSQIRMATNEEIKKYRPKIKEQNSFKNRIKDGK